MTEKRFTCETKTLGSVSVDLMKDNGQIIEKFDAIKLLNELWEEKEQLQHDATVLILSNKDYRKENEQLKQRISELELINNGLNYALKNIKKIDVEIDVGDVE